jgi:predicted O-methyltransferase YrrM
MARRQGDALKTLAADLPETIDLLLLDGAKSLYPEVLNLVESGPKAGAFIIADNADMSPDYLKRLRAGERLYVRALRRGRRVLANVTRAMDLSHRRHRERKRSDPEMKGAL